MDPTLLIGTSGAALILLAFVLEQFHVWRDEDTVYDFVNLVGSGLLIWYAVLLGSWPFIILNFIWALVSLRDFVKDLYGKK